MPAQSTSRRGRLGIATLQPPPALSHTHFSEWFSKIQEYHKTKKSWVCGIPHTLWVCEKRNARILVTVEVDEISNTKEPCKILLLKIMLKFSKNPLDFAWRRKNRWRREKETSCVVLRSFPRFRIYLNLNLDPSPPAQEWGNRTVAEHVCSKM